MNKEDVLKNCTITGNVIKLPDYQLDRKLYADVAKSLELIGGKWKRKEKGFLFNEDPTELLAQIANDEKRNLKKEFQFFGTPDIIADLLVSYADIDKDDVILEPSAGQGAIIKAIHRTEPDLIIDCCELMPVNQTFLKRLPNINFIADDFLNLITEKKYTKIIANPPFSKNQDIDHIRRMYELLVDGGTLVTICSSHWERSSYNKEKAFREWVYENVVHMEDITAGSFKESGTMVGCKILVIKK
jgi:hypothetical protein